MDLATWRARVAADRPPLSAAQLAVLRPVWAPVIPQMRNAATAETVTAPAMPAPKNTRGTCNGQR